MCVFVCVAIALLRLCYPWQFSELKRDRDEEEVRLLMEKHELKPTKALDEFPDPHDDPRRT